MKLLLLNTVNDRFSVSDVNAKPMRGSEQAWAYLSDELSQSGVETHSVFKSERVPRQRYDAAIAYRELDGLQHINAKVKLLWVQNPPKKDFTQRCQKFIELGCLDKIIVSTRYHRSTYDRDSYFKHRDDLFLFMDNGLPAALFEAFQVEQAHKQQQFLYASAPHRGLGHFVEIWPQLHRRLPNYTFHIAGHVHLYSDQFKVFNHKLYSQYQEVVHQLSELPNVHVHDKLNRDQYCRLMAASDALLYPCQTFEETSCITVHEAIALGCVPIVSSAGALPEIVLDGISGRVVDGWPRKFLKRQDHPESIAFRQRFTDTVVDTVESGSLPKLRQHSNPHIYSWQQQASTMTQQLSQLLQNSAKKTLFQRLQQLSAKITL